MNETQQTRKSISKLIANNLNNIIKINNKYKHLGYNIYLNGDSFEITYNSNKYYLSVKKENNKYYWHLEPYNGSFFETFVDNKICSLDMVICAINDNENIYRKEENNE